MSAFDQIQDNTYQVVAAFYGDDGSWLPAGTGQTALTGKVLFRDPTSDIELGPVTYSPGTAIMEYYPVIFPGLKTSVDQGGVETVTIKGAQYFVRAVTTKYDGKTMLAVLQPK